MTHKATGTSTRRAKAGMEVEDLHVRHQSCSATSWQRTATNQWHSSPGHPFHPQRMGDAQQLWELVVTPGRARATSLAHRYTWELAGPALHRPPELQTPSLRLGPDCIPEGEKMLEQNRDSSCPSAQHHAEILLTAITLCGLLAASETAAGLGTFWGTSIRCHDQQSLLILLAAPRAAGSNSLMETPSRDWTATKNLQVPAVPCL